MSPVSPPGPGDDLDGLRLFILQHQNGREITQREHDDARLMLIGAVLTLAERVAGLERIMPKEADRELDADVRAGLRAIAATGRVAKRAIYGFAAMAVAWATIRQFFSSETGAILDSIRAGLEWWRGPR